jgi:hypothetical protein
MLPAPEICVERHASTRFAKFRNFWEILLKKCPFCAAGIHALRGLQGVYKRSASKTSPKDAFLDLNQHKMPQNLKKTV